MPKGPPYHFDLTLLIAVDGTEHGARTAERVFISQSALEVVVLDYVIPRRVPRVFGAREYSQSLRAACSRTARDS